MPNLGVAMLIAAAVLLGLGTVLDMVFRARMANLGYKWVFLESARLITADITAFGRRMDGPHGPSI
jgi:hypothetical protein